MSEKTVEMQAKIYMYDLKNSAVENGFKPGDGWELNRATLEEKVEIEKKYQLTISAKVMPELLLELFSIVKNQLNIARQLITDKHAEPALVPVANQQYLVAFNPHRLKR